jgi:hypothetical protein
MEQNSNANSWLRSRTGLVFFGFAAILAECGDRYFHAGFYPAAG